MLATTPRYGFGVLSPSSDEADATAQLINAAKVPMFATPARASFNHQADRIVWRMLPLTTWGYAMAL